VASPWVAVAVPVGELDAEDDDPVDPLGAAGGVTFTVTGTVPLEAEKLAAPP
jgi:hypothetical protein